MSTTTAPKNNAVFPCNATLTRRKFLVASIALAGFATGLPGTPFSRCRRIDYTHTCICLASRGAPSGAAGGRAAGRTEARSRARLLSSWCTSPLSLAKQGRWISLFRSTDRFEQGSSNPQGTSCTSTLRYLRQSRCARDAGQQAALHCALHCAVAQRP